MKLIVHKTTQEFGGLAKINLEIDSLLMLIVSEGPKFHHSCS